MDVSDESETHLIVDNEFLRLLIQRKSEVAMKVVFVG